MEDYAYSPVKEQPVKIDMLPRYVEQTRDGLQVNSVTKPRIVKNDYMLWSVCNLICCCFLCGIPSLVYSVRTVIMNEIGEVQRATLYSRKSRKWNMIATIAGFFIITVFIIIYCFVLTNLLTNLQDMASRIAQSQTLST